jgi:hypothetical protein
MAKSLLIDFLQTVGEDFGLITSQGLFERNWKIERFVRNVEAKNDYDHFLVMSKVIDEKKITVQYPLYWIRMLNSRRPRMTKEEVVRIIGQNITITTPTKEIEKNWQVFNAIRPKGEYAEDEYMVILFRVDASGIVQGALQKLGVLKGMNIVKQVRFAAQLEQIHWIEKIVIRPDFDNDFQDMDSSDPEF